MAHRRRFGGGRGQPLARAVGLKGEDAPFVLDATAGVGTDAFVLATLGCTVTLIERLPEAVRALRRALAAAGIHAETSAITDRMTLLEGDAIELIGRWRSPPPDVIYLDPMYPHPKNKAANSKSMTVLQQLAGPDTDSDALLAAALTLATRRVVVKRPVKAPRVAGPEPSGSVQSTNTRYDLYGGALLAANQSDLP